MHKLILEQENSPGGQDDLVQFFSSLPSEQSRSPSHFQRLWIQNGGDSHWNWFSRSQSVVQKSSSVVSSQSGVPSQNLDSWIHFPSEQVTSDSEQLRYWSRQSISSELSPKKEFQIFNIIAATTIQILNILFQFWKKLQLTTIIIIIATPSSRNTSMIATFEISFVTFFNVFVFTFIGIFILISFTIRFSVT